MNFVSTAVMDRVGSCLSTACAIHCSLKPLLFLVPSVAWLDILMSHRVEQVLLASGVCLALGSTVWGFSRHRRMEVFLVLGFALSLILVGRLRFAGTLRTVLVVPGGLTIAATHVLNTKLCENCRSDGTCSRTSTGDS